MPAFTLAHSSDWHATTLAGVRLRELANKRLLGWLSWRYRRRHTQRPEILRAFFADVRRQAPDHVAVTGDLTNVALAQEFEEALGLLRELGPPAWVSVVPGNHDACVAVPRVVGWNRWADYLASDRACQATGREGAEPARPAAVALDFPAVRVRGPVALVGLCTALPTPPGLATGRVGPAQLDALARVIAELGDQGLCRVVLSHHPVSDTGYTPRRRLTDSAALRAVLAEVGAELVLHGHGHRRQIARLRGPAGEIPNIGVRSASHVAKPERHRAQYHLFRIEGDGASGFRIALSTRGYDAATASFRAEGEQDL